MHGVVYTLITAGILILPGYLAKCLCGNKKAGHNLTNAWSCIYANYCGYTDVAWLFSRIFYAAIKKRDII